MICKSMHWGRGESQTGTSLQATADSAHLISSIQSSFFTPIHNLRTTAEKQISDIYFVARFGCEQSRTALLMKFQLETNQQDPIESRINWQHSTFGGRPDPMLRIRFYTSPDLRIMLHSTWRVRTSSWDASVRSHVICHIASTHAKVEVEKEGHLYPGLLRTEDGHSQLWKCVYSRERIAEIRNNSDPIRLFRIERQTVILNYLLIVK